MKSSEEKKRVSNFLLQYVYLVLASMQFYTPVLSAQYIPSRPVTLMDHTMGVHGPFNLFMHKDSRGQVWISSSSGLYRYDGRKVKIYTPDPDDQTNLNPNYVHSFFAEDPKGNIWFGTWRGISCYIRKQDTFASFVLPTSNPTKRYMACGFDSLGKLWFTHDWGIFTLDTATGVMERLADISEGLSNAEIQRNEAGLVKYMYCYGRYDVNPGLSVVEFDTTGYCHQTTLFRDGPDSIGVSDVQVVADTTCLIATTIGLFMYNLETDKLRILTPNAIFGDWVVHSIAPFKDSLFLIGTDEYGYYVFDPAQQAFKERFHIRHKGEKLLQAPLAMYSDPEGAVWIHLDGQGVAYFHPEYHVFDFYPIEVGYKGLNKSLHVQSLVEIDNQTVLATTKSDGAYFIHLKEERIDTVTACVPCPSEFRSSFRDSKGRIWLVSDQDLYLMERGGRVQKISREKEVEFGFGFCELPDGRIINVSQGRLFISDTREQNGISFSRLTELDMHYKYSHIGVLPDGLFYATTVSNDPTKGGYLGIYDPEKGFGEVVSIPFSAGIRSIVAIPDRDEYLAGTTHGLYILDTSPPSCLPVAYASSGKQAIWKIFSIGESQYFLCGEKGFSAIDLNHQQSQSFGLEHGPGKEGTSWFAFLKHSSGKIWIGQNEGVSVVDPGRLTIPHFNHVVNIQDIRINEKPEVYKMYNTEKVSNPNEVRMMRLPPAMNTVSFDFAALTYAGNDATVFEYRMQGVEEEWVDGGRQGFARYVNLAPGEYSFEVRVKDQPDSVHTLGLYIIPPFYMRGWFLAILGVCILYVIYHVTRFSAQRKQRKVQQQYEKQLAIEQDRLRISNNLHDDLGSGLAALNLRAQVIAQHTRDASTKDQVNQLAENTRKLVGQIRETIWTINSQHDTVDSLVTRLHQYTIEFFENTGIECKVQLMPDQILARIPGEHRREIYLAFKEALHNVVKHARATYVSVNMTIDSAHQLNIEIRDDGTGFDSGMHHSGLGINSMKKRMEGIGGSMRLMSGIQGTSISLLYRV